ncbi:putative toxin-antitoxin system toxin component, PIN family [Candidatus Poribacteria bacterium]|nr:putative toxin-antitoxin system toxin component, PIN family [Candidatus Poribacteria bacterium]
MKKPRKVIRAVLDANIHLSATFFPKGKPRQVRSLGRRGFFQIIISQPILAEIRKAMNEDFGRSDEMIAKELKKIRKYARIVKPKVKINFITTDTNDNRILECAVKGKSDFIVTGDKHLLEIGEYDKVKIVTASQFLELLMK